METVARLFKGQEKANTTFSVSDNSAQYNLLENEFGLGNRLLIDTKTLQENLNAVQKAHALPQTEIDSAQAFPISVEMETGKYTIKASLYYLFIKSKSKQNFFQVITLGSFRI